MPEPNAGMTGTFGPALTCHAPASRPKDAVTPVEKVDRAARRPARQSNR